MAVPEYKLKGINVPPKKPVFCVKNAQPFDINSSVECLERAACIHKQVRGELYPLLRPGVKLLDLANFVEKRTVELSNEKNSLNKGIGFPIGLSINNCAAHYHPCENDPTQLKHDDIIKVDFGVEVGGWIIDSAFTVYFDDRHEPLANAVREATELGIKNAAVDADIDEWSRSIQEVMEAHEVHPIRNLGGHNILKGLIHGEYYLPSYPGQPLIHKRFAEGVYAIETFGSTGTDMAIGSGETTIYRTNPYKNPLLKLDSSRKFMSKLQQSFKTLPFSTRFIDFAPNPKTQLNILSTNKNIIDYPPLSVIDGNTAQYEHTIYLGENGQKIVFSKGDDY
jgi:methionyl aminopeptidase